MAVIISKSVYNKSQPGKVPSVWITDAVPTSSGILGQKTYRSFIATSPLIDTGISNTYNVRIRIGGSGDNVSYSPIITINGITATITESSTVMWFTGYADIVLVDGPNTIIATNGIDTDTITITVSIGGPTVLSIVFGSYPGVQTSLKRFDSIPVTITTALSATSVTIQSGGASNAAITLPVTNGIASGSLIISSASGSQYITVIAYNSLGTAGSSFNSSTLILDQIIPTFTLNSITYPIGQLAAKVNDTVAVNVTTSNYNNITYSSTQLTIPNTTTYSQTKNVTVTFVGYNIANNYTITATKTANNSSATFNTIVKIANTIPTASITILNNPTRLISNVTGISYEIHINPTQILSVAPSLNASIGAWAGSWTLSGAFWKRNLVITNSDARGTGLFSALSLTNEANISGTTITSGSNYIVGGFSSIIVTFPPFSRVAPIGVNIADQTKTSVQIVGGNTLTRYTNNSIQSNGYYIANIDETYNPNGAYVGLSDSVFAGANTSGTLQATIQEVV